MHHASKVLKIVFPVRAEARVLLARFDQRSQHYEVIADMEIKKEAEYVEKKSRLGNSR